jgi:hypothetical protein
MVSIITDPPAEFILTPCNPILAWLPEASKFVTVHVIADVAKILESVKVKDWVAVEAVVNPVIVQDMSLSFAVNVTPAPDEVNGAIEILPAVGVNTIPPVPPLIVVADVEFVEPMTKVFVPPALSAIFTEFVPAP